MSRLSLPAFPPALPARLASLLVTAGGSWLLAGLIGDFIRPLPPPAETAAPEAAVIAERLAGHLAFAGATPQAAPLNLMLVGVSASADPALARAVIRQEGRPSLLVAAIGDEIGNGQRLKAIEADAVTLSGNDGDSRLALPQPANPLPLPPHDD